MDIKTQFSIAIIRFGLRPEDFWALSLKEWLWLIGTLAPQIETLSRKQFSDLMSHFPDIKDENTP